MRLETLAEQKQSFVQPKESQNWKTFLFPCGSPQIPELMIYGKLSASTSNIADYLVYTEKFAELLETPSLASVIAYDNQYRKLQSRCGFCWGKDSPHLHIGFLVKRSPFPLTTTPLTQKFPSQLSRQPQVTYTTSICRQFNSLTG